MPYVSTLTGQADTVYDRSHVWQISPWESNGERLLSQQLAILTSPQALNAARPPEQVLFPPRFGYRTTALGIDDISVLDDLYPAARDYSRVESGYEGTMFPSGNHF